MVVLGFGVFGPAGAGDNGTTMIVKKVVTGTGTAGSTVVVDCDGGLAGDSATLTFDKNGAPNTTTNTDWQKLNGGWTLFDTLGNANDACSFEETVTGGATSTSFTCAYQNVESDEIENQQIELGCDAASGTGTGPVEVLYGFNLNVFSQTSTVTFTNTFQAATTTTTTTTPTTTTTAAAPVATSPTFTG